MSALASARSKPFPVRFEQAVHRLEKEPSAPSIPTKLCFDYFGDDLLRYVPPPNVGLWPFVRTANSGTGRQGFLDGHDWAHLKFSLETTPQFKLARDLANGTPYRQTEVYRLVKARLAKGRFQRVNGVLLDSQEKIERYCEYVQWLIDSVRENGLRSRSEVAHLCGPSFDGVRSAGKETAEREIQIAVDKDGGLLRLNTGRHRLAVAHALGLQEVPAKIHLVHAGWVTSLVRETGERPDVALRGWLGRFRSAAAQAKVRLIAVLCGLKEAGEFIQVLA